MSRVPVFDRIHRRVHPYEAALQSIFDNPVSMEDRAAARNLSHEHRVTTRRRRKLNLCVKARIRERLKQGNDFNRSPTRDDLLDAAKKYFADFVRSRSEPDFTFPGLNDTNLLKVNGQRLHDDAPDDEELLVNVLDLNGLYDVYMQAFQRSRGAESSYPEWHALFGDLEIEKNKDAWPWLDRKLGSESSSREGLLAATDNQKKFVKEVLVALNNDREGWQGGVPHPYQPMWATPWNEFRSATQWTPGQIGDPGSCLEVAGVSKKTPGRWLILLVYPVAVVRTLARPTILDGESYPWHFPSPPCASPGTGGHPIDLGKKYRAGRPISEFIHAQIALSPSYWEQSGYAIGRTSNVVGADLSEARGFHREKLRNHYQEFWREDWMNKTC